MLIDQVDFIKLSNTDSCKLRSFFDVLGDLNIDKLLVRVAK